MILEAVQPQDQELLDKVIINFNKYAMQCVNFDKLQEAAMIFEKLLRLVKGYWNQNPKLICLTYNNLSCLMKKNNEIDASVNLLTKALGLAKMTECSEYLPLTYINLSAIYSINHM